jgi:hypothetical protein
MKLLNLQVLTLVDSSGIIAVVDTDEALCE